MRRACHAKSVACGYRRADGRDLIGRAKLNGGATPDARANAIGRANLTGRAQSVTVAVCRPNPESERHDRGRPV